MGRYSIQMATNRTIRPMDNNKKDYISTEDCKLLSRMCSILSPEDWKKVNEQMEADTLFTDDMITNKEDDVDTEELYNVTKQIARDEIEASKMKRRATRSTLYSKYPKDIKYFKTDRVIDICKDSKKDFSERLEAKNELFRRIDNSKISISKI